MPIEFYYMKGSAPCRAVMLTAKALGLDLIFKEVSVLASEQLNPEFVKINPQHLIPTIVDDGYVLWESRAINVYLVTKYGNDDSMCPIEAKKQGLLHQRLNFDLGTLYQRFDDAYFPAIFFGGKEIHKDKVTCVDQSMSLLDLFLAQSKWSAGDHITIADHSLVATVSTMDAVGYDLTPYKNVTNWYKQCQKEMPGYKEANQEGVDDFRELAKQMLAGKKYSH